MFIPATGLFRYKHGDTDPRYGDVKAAVEVKIGDLLIRESASRFFVPAASFPWTTNFATTAAAAAPLFAGVAMQHRAAADVQRGVRIATRGIFQYPDDGLEKLPGEFITFGDGTTTLLSQQVAETATAALAIGKTYEYYSAAAGREIWFDIRSRLFQIQA